MKKTSKGRKIAEMSAEYKVHSGKKGRAMAVETLENLLKKADRLTPAERLLLASRLIESVRQRDLSSPAVKSQRTELKKSLEKLARLKVFADITNPVEWQRQIRKDRPLPGRAA